MNNLIELRTALVTKESLWDQYYEGLPNGYSDDMSGLEFEKCIENLLIKLGYKAYRTRASGDQGVDIIAEDNLGKKIAIQTKKYKDKVGNYAVQEVATGKNIYRCSEAWVITNSTFTASAIQLAMFNNVRLINGVEMIKMFQEVDTEDRDIPEFDEEKYKRIESIATRLYKVRDIDFTYTRTKYDTQIHEMNMEIKELEKYLQKK